MFYFGFLIWYQLSSSRFAFLVFRLLPILFFIEIAKLGYLVDVDPLSEVLELKMMNHVLLMNFCSSCPFEIPHALKDRKEHESTFF